MADPDDIPTEDRSSQPQPLREIEGSRGYGAGKGDLVNLVPPPDDLGVGAPQPKASGDGERPDPPVQSNDPGRSPSDGESGIVRLDTAQFVAGLLLLIAVVYLLRNDPKGLGLALVLGAMGWYLGRLSYGLPV